MYVDGLREWRKAYGKRCVVKGRAEGVAEGELKNQKANFQDALETRFGAVPQAVRTYLDSAADLAALRRLTKGAWRAESLDAFLALLAEESRQGD